MPTGCRPSGLNIGFRLDGLALLFALLITAIGVLIVLYAAYYLGPEDPAGKLYALLMLFMAAMLGVVLSDNLLMLVVFWELTSVSSFLLVGYWGHRADARAGARMALAVTGGGGLAMLAGVILLGQAGGSYELSVLLERGDAVRAHPHYPADPRAGAGGLLHQERAGALPLLAARGDGGAHAGVGLPALGHHGEGGRVPARAAVPGAGRHRRLPVLGGRRRAGDAGLRRLRRRVQARPEGPAGLFHHQPPGPDRLPARPARRRWPRWPRCSTC